MIKFKKLDYKVIVDGEEVVKPSEAKLPTKATEDSAGYDVYCTRMTQEVDNSGKIVLVYHTDMAIELPHGFVGLLCMKSSVAKRSLSLCNAVGVIDSDYRGEIMGKFKVTTDAVPSVYAVGEPFAQLIIVPVINKDVPVFVDELVDTERGDMGFGEATEKKLGEDDKQD